jgi:hypothetical protein
MPNANDVLVNDIVAATGYPVCIVSVLVGLSLPLRSMFISFLNKLKALLLAEKAKLVGKTKAADVLARKLDAVTQAGRLALAPYDTILNALPFQQMAQNCGLFGDQFQKLWGNIPVSIPVTPATQILGFDGFDAFSGVKNYTSLRSKLDEITFRMERALTISDKANKLSHDLDDNLSAIDMYLNILSRSQ